MPRGVSAGDGEITVALSEPLAALPAFLAEFRSQILAPASYGMDVPMVPGRALVPGLGFVLVNAAIDLAVRRIDPRVAA